METKSTVFARNTSQGLLLITALIAVVFLPSHSSAQQGNADSILAVRKDTFVIRFTELSINTVKNRKIKDDTFTIYILPKAEIGLLVYGNSEREAFQGLTIAPDTAIKLPRQRYDKQAKLLAFQQEITHWQPSELVSQKQKFRSNSVVCTVFGIITAIAGPALIISGSNKIWDDSDKSLAQMTGGFLISGGAVPLFIFGFKNGRRAKLIKIEQERRTSIKY
ncbi:MAG: hypothetical protein J7619_02125 [Dyadobacter sp.]|uniref:hypothetical protein n=1 Tax=Dyadobacter sp. TaxID=1914288 RepID=UPI001B1B34D6|nr:hypothetical protein [Dyadobacter sp.]MBO9611459.1 hypothetical protein [Dyadobacter sp.]